MYARQKWPRSLFCDGLSIFYDLSHVCVCVTECRSCYGWTSSCLQKSHIIWFYVYITAGLRMYLCTSLAMLSLTSCCCCDYCMGTILWQTGSRVYHTELPLHMYVCTYVWRVHSVSLQVCAAVRSFFLSVSPLSSLSLVWETLKKWGPGSVRRCHGIRRQFSASRSQSVFSRSVESCMLVSSVWSILQDCISLLQ